MFFLAATITEAASAMMALQKKGAGQRGPGLHKLAGTGWFRLRSRTVQPFPKNL